MHRVQPFKMHPGRWIGLATPYEASWIEHFKNTQPVRAWDPQAKIWWIPEGRAAIAIHDIAAFKLCDVQEAENFLAKLKSTDPRNAKIRYSAVTEVAIDNAYAKLGLQRNAPRALVDLAYKFWCSEFAVGGMEQHRYEIDMAYETIIAQGDA